MNLYQSNKTWIEVLKEKYKFNFVIICPTRFQKMLNSKDIISYPGLFNEACANFILKQGSFLLTCGCPSMEEHVKDVLFNLVNDLNENNIYETTFAVDGVDGKTLADFAKKNLYRFCSVEEVIENIAHKNIYQKHLEYLKKNWYSIDEKQFAEKIGLTGLFKKLRLRRLIFN